MPTTEDTRYVRFAVTRAEHRQLRLAAANRDTPMAHFVRRTSLAAAAEELQKLDSSGASARAKKQRKKRPAMPGRTCRWSTIPRPCSGCIPIIRSGSIERASRSSWWAKFVSGMPRWNCSHA